jgi:hypothetical protein
MMKKKNYCVEQNDMNFLIEKPMSSEFEKKNGSIKVRKTLRIK